MSQHLNHVCKQSSAFERLAPHLICPRPSNAKQIKLADARPKQWTSRHWNLSAACLKQMERIHRSHLCKHRYQSRGFWKKLRVPMCGLPRSSAYLLWEQGTKCRELSLATGIAQVLLNAPSYLWNWGRSLPSCFSAKQCLDRETDRANSQVNAVVKKSPGNTFNKRLEGYG